MQLNVRMKVTDLQSQPKVLKVTTLVLDYDYDNPTDVKMFYCPRCRQVVFSYNGYLAWIIPGDIPFDINIPTYHQCIQCKTTYMVIKMV